MATNMLDETYGSNGSNNGSNNERIAGGDMQASTSHSQSREVIEIERKRAILEALKQPEEANRKRRYTGA
ncbi:hypothetical protein CTI12_AA078940 [Artemisia annua]|uniref:Uncharacterized protein n=1 Tax=Artemisia annua TaxID=35608 RepID=A0A2U1Q3K5_ARTAN|nr:hypothetical protein CTI12_AA078940 [Artemisia annua]